MNTVKFEAGKSYKVKFITDSDMECNLEVTRRTKSYIFYKLPNNRTVEKRSMVKEHDGVEFILPYGQYSMAPVCKASRPADKPTLTEIKKTLYSHIDEIQKVLNTLPQKGDNTADCIKLRMESRLEDFLYTVHGLTDSDLI